MARTMPDASNQQRASTVANGQLKRSTAKRQAGKADFKQPGDPFGSWGDNNLALLSAQAETGLQTPDKRSSGTAFCQPSTSTQDRVRDFGAQTDSAVRSVQPCNSEGLTIDSNREPVASGTEANQHAQEVTQPLPSEDRDAAVAEDALRRLSAGSSAADRTTEPSAGDGAAVQQSPPDAEGNSAKMETSRPAGARKAKRRSKKGGLYADIIGKEVNVPASIFDIQVPDLFYRAVVKRKDTGHPGAVVIRFPEDGSHFWLPVEQVRQYIADMEAQPGKGQQSLAGERSAAFAAEVLVSLSGVQTDSGSAGDALHAKPHQQQKQKRQQQPGGSEVESAIATPGRKRRRKDTAS